MSEYIEIQGLKLYYHAAGKKENPALIFLPAWGAQVDWLPPAVSEFSKHFYTIALEHPGLMRSDTPADSSFDARAHVLNSFLESLHINTPVILVGNSFGGAVATAYAIQNPDKIQTLILLDSAVSDEFKVTSFVKSHHAFYRGLISSSLIPLIFKKQLIKTYLGTPTSFLSKEEIGKKIKMLKNEHSLVADYKKLSVPTFLVWGTQDRSVHPIKYARTIVTLIPNSKLLEYKGSVPTIYKEPKKVVSIIVKALGFS